MGPVVALVVWTLSMIPPLFSVASLSCGMHAVTERLVRENVDSSWAAAGMAMGMAGASLLGIGCSGLQMAIRVFAVMGAAICLAGWVFAHSEIALHELLHSSNRTAAHIQRTLDRFDLSPAARDPILCSVRGLHDSILLIVALQRTVEFWRAVSHHISTIARMPPLLLAGIAAIAPPPAPVQAHAQ